LAKIQAIRGMNDVLPDKTPHWQYLEQTARELLAAYAYQEIRFPILEQTLLFKRSIGEVTDIVEKEMYTFEDRNGDSLSLRPEGTACCVRAAEQHGLLYNQVQKLWYMGPMYRHERPQKGRYRQFYQLGIEAFGMSGTAIEAEVIMLSADFWRKLGILDYLKLEINNLGAAADRAAYGKALKAYLLQHKPALDEDSQRRLDANVLRILDSKSPETQAILKSAPELTDFVSPESKTEFNELLEILAQAGIAYQIMPAMVRGLDYYNGMVFEWTTDQLGAQSALGGGGRFDGLAKQLGGSDTPAVGFAAGMERILLLLETLSLLPSDLQQQADVFIAIIEKTHQHKALLLAQQLRNAYPQLRVLTHCGGGKYNSQIKKAYASEARCALVFEGEDNLTEIKFRMLDENSSSETIKLSDFLEAFSGKLEQIL
jgi:histidyl-tRNA synthetase